jgi:hypothetical protein
MAATEHQIKCLQVRMMQIISNKQSMEMQAIVQLKVQAKEQNRKMTHENNTHNSSQVEFA